MLLWRCFMKNVAIKDKIWVINYIRLFWKVISVACFKGPGLKDIFHWNVQLFNCILVTIKRFSQILNWGRTLASHEINPQICGNSDQISQKWQKYFCWIRWIRLNYFRCFSYKKSYVHHFILFSVYNSETWSCKIYSSYLFLLLN